jgi:hypothetical protein
MANDHGEGARLMRIDDLRRRLAVAFERLQLTSEEHLANARVIG